MPARGGPSKRKQRQASSDMDTSEEDDKLEELLAKHHQRDLSDWGQADQGTTSNDGGQQRSRNARRDQRRDERRKRRRDEERAAFNPDESFEVDTVGSGVVEGLPLPRPASTKGGESATKSVEGLLLPGHVDIQTEADADGVQRGLSDTDSKEPEDEQAMGEMGDFIRMDADRSGVVSRYYEVEEEEQRKAHEECLTCGEKGHDKKSCPHELCLACGALDEHSTRQCPMGISCFRCGGRGHKAVDCKKPRTGGVQGWKECTRCFSTAHVESKCPTLWRIYCYNPVDIHRKERQARYKDPAPRGLDRRRPQAGFNYRSDESDSDSEEEREAESTLPSPPSDWDPAVRWCYNCAAQGNHWGDDCPIPRSNRTQATGDPSPYSEFLASTGPFARQLAAPPPIDAQAYRRGLRPGEDLYDRFDAGPGASMHVYDPQREAMKSVDVLLDRFATGQSRRKDAHKRRREDKKYERHPVDRRSGQGSKAQRYREMEADRSRPSERWWDREEEQRGARSRGGRNQR